MPRLLTFALVLVVMGGTLALSRQAPPGDASPMKIAAADKNPWTKTALNNDANQFQFAIVSDRTGGHRAKIFSQAVHRINLLQPEFVMSVGDLIEGYTLKPDVMEKQWNEFDGFTAKFDMPFFLVPGNHDLTNKQLAEYWQGRYGKTYYHFTYKDVLFLAINSEDGKESTVTAEQNAAIKKALDENKSARWVLLFVHKPMWADKDLEANGWAEVEKNLEGRKYTVFCGHVHRYQKYVRNGMNYYQLATTGGGSRLRGAKYGEFDHISWITMKQDGPRIAHVMLDGILPENLETPSSEEEGVVRKLKKLEPVKGMLSNNGKPVAGATISFHTFVKLPMERFAFTADAFTDADGSFVPSTYEAFDGLPAGEYTVTIFHNGKYRDYDPKGKSLLPEKYTTTKTTPLKVIVKEGDKSEIKIELID